MFALRNASTGDFLRTRSAESGAILTPRETRQAVNGMLAASGRKLTGYAAVFGQETRVGGFTEIIHQGAFKSSLAGRDVLCLVDHDQGRLLARTKSGTLRLQEDAKGLFYEIDLPDTQEGRDILTLAQRGDLGGMSFGFTVRKGGDHWTGKRRELREVVLHEISVVHCWPAYEGTSVEPRAKAPRLTAALRYLETVTP
jgi:HK97 family phage prohead protease